MENTENKTPAYSPEDFASVARNYQVPMSKETLEQMAQGADDKKFKAFEDYAKTMAMGLYPSFAPQISAGIPTAHLLEPYRQAAKLMLGNDFEPDFINDPKSAAVLMGGRDEKTGRPTPMTLDQWRTHIRSHPEFQWGYSPEAHGKANMLLSNLRLAMKPQG